VIADDLAETAYAVELRRRHRIAQLRVSGGGGGGEGKGGRGMGMGMRWQKGRRVLYDNLRSDASRRNFTPARTVPTDRRRPSAVASDLESEQRPHPRGLAGATLAQSPLHVQWRFHAGAGARGRGRGGAQAPPNRGYARKFSRPPNRG